MKRYIPGRFTPFGWLRGVVFVLVLVLPAMSSQAAEAVKLEELLRAPALSNPIFSRSGKFFAATAPSPSNKRMNLVVVDMSTRKGELITGFKDFDVIDVHWVGE